MPNHNSQPAGSVTDRNEREDIDSSSQRNPKTNGSTSGSTDERDQSDENPLTANTMGTDRAPEKKVPKSPEADADLPEIEKGSERGSRGELLRPSERESTYEIEI